MPDSLIINDCPVQPPIAPVAEASSADMPTIPFNTTHLVARLYREAQAAADALDASEEADDGPLHKGYFAATDRFIEAPVNTMGDVLLKLDHIAYHEDLEAMPRLIINRTLLSLLRDLRATEAADSQRSGIEAARRRAASAQGTGTTLMSDSTHCTIETLRRECAVAEQRLEASHEEDDGPLAKAFFEVQDRLIAEPVRTSADLLHKLEYLAQHELLDDPRTIPAQVATNLIRDVRAAQSGAFPALDVVAVHRAADEQVDEIYRLLARMVGGLEALRHLGPSLCKGPDDWEKMRFVIDALSDTNDEIIDANDRLTNAIDPLNPTVLDDGSST